MKFFKSFTMKWWQVGIFKLALLSAGIAIGAYWSEFFSGLIVEFSGLAAICAIYIWFVWAKK